MEKSQELAVTLLEEAKEKGTLDPAIEDRLAKLAGVDVRPKLAEVLKSSDKPLTAPELIEALELEAQYGECLKTLQHYRFLKEDYKVRKGYAKMPTYEESMATFSLEELSLAGQFQKPTLILIPETSFAAKVKALDMYCPGWTRQYVNDDFFLSDVGSSRITGWRALIADGAQAMELYKGDDLGLTLGQRVEARRAARKDGEKGMDKHAYALLMMMETMRSDSFIDSYGTYTLLDDDSLLSEVEGHVPHAGYDNNEDTVVFHGSGSDSIDYHARFRSAVGGDKLLQSKDQVI